MSEKEIPYVICIPGDGTSNPPVVPQGEQIHHNVEYWFFVTNLIQNLCKDFGIDEAGLRQRFLAHAIKEEQAKLIADAILCPDVVKGSTELFRCLPFRKETFIVERVIEAILMENGYSLSSPETCAALGRKMLESVTTPFVREPMRELLVGAIGSCFILNQRPMGTPGTSNQTPA